MSDFDIYFRLVTFENAGDGARKKDLMFSVSGMSCANCALKVERMLKGKPGVVDMSVSSIRNKVMLILSGKHSYLGF